MLKGVLFALSACFIWGLIFVIPEFMQGYSPVEIVVCRYLFYGGISLLFLLKARLKNSCVYPFSVWIKALFLSILSGYYFWVILGIRYSSPEVCALILGISPITIVFYGNWKEKEGNFKLLIFPSFLIVIGLIIINIPRILMNNFSVEYVIGLICSLISLISWSAYVVLNSRFLKRNSYIAPSDWATIQGVSTLFWVVICSVLWTLSFGAELDLQKYFNWNYDAISFFAGCAILGLLCSWFGGVLWNKATVCLPVSIAGQLMIFETIFGISFVYILTQEAPNLMECAGMILLLGSVIYGIRTLNSQPHRSLDDELQLG